MDIKNKIKCSIMYKKWRSKVIRLADYKCSRCHMFGSDCVQAHHKKELMQIIIENNIENMDQAENCDELWDINNGECICSFCHIEHHTKKKGKLPLNNYKKDLNKKESKY